MSNRPSGLLASSSAPQNNSWPWFGSYSNAEVVPNRQFVFDIVVLTVGRVQL